MSIETLKIKPEATPCYELQEEELRRLSLELIRENATAEMLQNPFGCYMVDGSSPYANIGRDTERRVFFREFKNTAERLEQEYGPYEESSTFFIVMAHKIGEDTDELVDFEPVGVMRIIENSAAGIKALADLPKTDARTSHGRKIFPEDVYSHYNIDPEKCVEIATAAVAKEWRGETVGRFPSLLLYRSLYLHILRNQEKYTHVLAIMDQKPKKRLDDMHMPFEPILGSLPFPYLDDKETPTSLSEAIIAENQTFYPEVKKWAAVYFDEADQLKQLVERTEASPEVFSDQESVAFEETNKEATRKNMLGIGMMLLADGEYTIEAPEPDEEIRISIDGMLSPEIVVS